MPFGYDQEQNVVNLGDSADLYAYLYDRDQTAIAEADILSVQFIVEKPDGSRTTKYGEVQENGDGYIKYADTDLPGEYRVVAQFTFSDGSIKSTRSDFEVYDPFDPPTPDASELISQLVWRKIQDCFDSADGGPWMKDMTLNVFSPNRIKDFIAESLMDINVYNPPTHLGIDTFTQKINNAPNPNLTILVQGTFISVVRHLMRSYVEQPNPTGGQITFEDRRDYMQRWGTIYQIEFQHYDHLVKLWKRQFLGLGQTKSLVSSKAGRLLPASLRTRNIGRGYF